MTRKQLQEYYVETRIAGVSFANDDGSSRQDALAEIEHQGGALPITLKRKPKNRFDPNAIAVFHEDKQIGYVPRQLAEELAPIIDAGIEMRAHIVSIGQNAVGLYGLTIRIDWVGP